MRLRLRIHRNELPAVSTLWPVNDTQLRNTIAQLLEHVNQIFPLETEAWGLEEYTVTIGGYECLHYHELGAVCKDEDEVVIKPLQFAEVRARTLLGRDQISSDGRHLFDGLPFGRPYLKGVIRPDVRIPPKKRLRLDLGDQEVQTLGEEEEEYDSEDHEALALLRRTESEEDSSELDNGEDEDEDKDEDFEVEEEVISDSVESTTTRSSSSNSDASDSSSGSSSEDSGNHSDKDMSDQSWGGLDSQPNSAISQTADQGESPLQTSLGIAPSSGNAAPLVNGHSEVNGDPVHATTLKRKQPIGDPAPQSQQVENVKKIKLTPPGEGDRKTRDRNARRRDAKKLKHLKEAGVLPKNANLARLHEWEASDKTATPGDNGAGSMEADSHSSADIEGEHQPNGVATDGDKATSADTSDHVTARSVAKNGGTDDGALSTSVAKKAEQAAKLEQQRQKLLDAIANGGIDVSEPKAGSKRTASDMDDDGPPEEMSAKEPGKQARGSTNSIREEESERNSMDVETTAKAESKATTAMVPASVARRSRLDLAGSKRLLFGSLGVRVPSTQAQKEALQKKLADRAKKSALPVDTPSEQTEATTEQPEASEAEPPEEEDPEAWRSKIELSAVECCDEGVVLSTPPFPFHQRWDPQYSRKKSKGRNSKKHMAAKKRQNEGHSEQYEEYDKYNTDGNGDALDYDDPVEDDEYWEEGALLGDEDVEDDDVDAAAQQLRDEAAGHQVHEDDFPSLPADLTQLPALVETDALKCDFIVYKELTCSPATNWQPTMLTRTAKLLEKADDGWNIKLALRDLRPKEFDGEGNRVYRKFEMEGMSDDEDEGDARERLVQWAELLEPKLLHREPIPAYSP